MNEFVNYKKRDITLPQGCKNLHDVLKLEEEQHIPGETTSAKPITITRDESVIGPLSEIGKYVEMAFASSGQIFVLRMNSSDERFALDVKRMFGNTLRASATFPQDSTQAIAVWNFCARRGLKAPLDSGMPSSFIPSLAVDHIYQISPLPSDVPSLTELFTDLFRDVCGAEGNTALRFHFFETKEAA